MVSALIEQVSPLLIFSATLRSPESRPCKETVPSALRGQSESSAGEELRGNPAAAALYSARGDGAGRRGGSEGGCEAL